MSLYDWFKSLSGHGHHVILKSVSFDQDGVTSRHSDGTAERFAWKDLRRVELITTDQGNIAEDDVFLVLHGREMDCIIPESTDGFDTLVMHLQQFPHFDSEAVLKAMNCTENARFLCWTAEEA